MTKYFYVTFSSHQVAKFTTKNTIGCEFTLIRYRSIDSMQEVSNCHPPQVCNLLFFGLNDGCNQVGTWFSNVPKVNQYDNLPLRLSFEASQVHRGMFAISWY
jgi:hypothetical protein